MSVSWRRILERAGDGLTPEEDEVIEASPPSNSAALKPSSWLSRPADPIADARDRLARELRTISPASVQDSEPRHNRENASGRNVTKRASEARPSKSRAQTQSYASQSAKRHWSRNLVAVFISSTVIVSTAYAFMQQWPSRAGAYETTRRSLAISEVKDNAAAQASVSLTEQEEDVLLYRASKLLEAGDFATARTLYQNLASRGSQRGAIGIAETYDPNILLKVSIKGLKPDTDKARAWYQRAAELGSKNAQDRIDALSSVN